MLAFEERELEPGIWLLTLRGRLDALTAPDLRPTIDSMVKNDRHHVVCDLRDLETIDSSGVGAIVSLFKRSRMKGGEVKIARLRGQPKEIFRLLRLDRAFELFEEIEPAVARLRRR